jgi:hypothetical protein
MDREPDGAARLCVVMARYYFDTGDQNAAHDEDGLDLEDSEAALRAALAALPDMLKDRDLASLREELAITVRDETGPLFVTTVRLLARDR